MKPKFFEAMKSYSKGQFAKDVVAGIIVAIIALPLSIALALASGVNPSQGIYTAIFAGFVIALLGSSLVQVSGPTAAFATIVAGIVAKSGMTGLAVATIMAGIILVLMGLLRFGALIKFIPYTIVTGFTSGIAVTIVIGQLKDFLGLTFNNAPIETLGKLKEVVNCISTINYQAVIVGVVSLLILILFPLITEKIPASLIAVLVSIAMVKGLSMDVNTIGSLYEISNKLPAMSIPQMDLNMIKTMLPSAFTIAILAAIESLLSCVVSDEMIGDKHNPNMELIGQGAGNIASALFGGIPATGAIARTAANVKNGGRTPVAAMVHSVVLVLVLLVLMPYAALIPMPAIAAILFMVAYNMCGWKQFVNLTKKSPKSDIFVLFITFILTIVFDLVVAIEIGFAIATLLFIKRMAEVSEVRSWTYVEEEKDGYMVVPKGTLVYEIVGPMFFADEDKFMDIKAKEDTKAIIIRMRSVPSIDASALRKLVKIHDYCVNNNITLIFSHVNEQPEKMMRKAGFIEKVSKENFCVNIDAAMERAHQICED